MDKKYWVGCNLCVLEYVLIQGLSQTAGCVPEDAVQEGYKKTIRLSCDHLPVDDGF